MNIVPTTDLATVYDLRRRVLRTGRLAHYGVASEDDERVDAVHLIARLGEVPVGAISLIPNPCPVTHAGRIGLSWPAAPRCVEVVGMVVLNQYQRQGAGSRLLRHGWNCVKEDVDLMWAHARCTSLGFYERHGFSIVGEQYDVLPGVAHRLVLRPVGQSVSGLRSPGRTK